MGMILRPYKYCHNGVELSLERYKLDGHIKSVSQQDRDESTLNLTSKRFDKVTLEFSYDKKFEMSDYAPEDNPSMEIIVILHNSPTNTRRVILREEIDGEREFDIGLKKEDFRGEIEIEPVVVRSEENNGGAAGYAAEKHKKISSGNSWSLVLDESPSSGTGLICEWEDFTKPELEQVDEEMMYYLDIETLDEPRLLLNRKSERLTTMMDNQASRGKRASIRDVLNDVVFLPAMFELMMRSVAAVDNEEFEGHYIEETLFEDFSRVLDLTDEEMVKAASITNKEGEMEKLGEKISLYLQKKYSIGDDMDKMLQKVMEG